MNKIMVNVDKTIVFVGHEVSRTGAPKSLLNIAKIAKASGYNFLFVLGKSGELLEDYQSVGRVLLWRKSYLNDNIIKKILRKIGFISSPNYNEIIKEIIAVKPIIIFNNTVVNGSILESLKFLNVPIISRIPELESVIRLFNIKGESDKVIKLSDKIVAVSNAVKENLILNHDVDPKKIEVIHGFTKKSNIILSDEIKTSVRQEMGIDDKSFVIGNCASLIYRKGFDFFIQLADLLKHENNIHFIWIGGKKESSTFIEIELELEKRKLNHMVKFLGDKSNVYHYLANFNMFFLSSREEPFSQSMIEAAQHKLPIIGFKNTGGIEEFLTNGGGFLADLGDISSLAEFVIKVKNEQQMLSILSEESYKNYLSFSEDAIQDKWLSFFNSYS
jgi:glycosyltransferase involved in cell wall biosynthesis